ncbi:hypothetical protein [Sphingomonas ginsenosidimutans]|jgi:hypothetical protein|uniref:hypothetical protein n=1 Tax=Sphingomonas ginsenosidimutans TaxID=862134 RepID=UPI001D9F5324|nr:hypothetical protein [Sphingomonas ginsenosidimutans]MBY0301227.1 hypothetical protein [Sphingomonas ginsenosidimutans]
MALPLSHAIGRGWPTAGGQLRRPSDVVPPPGYVILTNPDGSIQFDPDGYIRVEKA